VEKARAALAGGYRKIKLKIQPGADVTYVRAVRQALGEDVHIMVDANSAYSLADIEVFEQLDALGLLMIEQPLAVQIVPETGVGGYENTMLDIVFNLLGGILAVTWLAWSGRIPSPAQQ